MRLLVVVVVSWCSDFDAVVGEEEERRLLRDDNSKVVVVAVAEGVDGGDKKWWFFYYCSMKVPFFGRDRSGGGVENWNAEFCVVEEMGTRVKLLTVFGQNPLKCTSCVSLIHK
jgi:hypothetical protein